ncbi:hypothetical protein AAF712_015390 [Marasmius tenuissimus]|uniref:Uncharacterized protein n=1 Tax=Marasmius tenuissimus TaxID=585030 RepID=A0ABR2Z9J5_9AGAR
MELSRVESDNLELREKAQAESRRASIEVERLRQANAEFQETLRFKDLLHAAKIQQEREESCDREKVLQQLLRDQRKEREFGITRNSDIFTDQRLVTLGGIQQLLALEYEGKISELNLKIEDLNAKLERAERTGSDHIARDLQQRTNIESKDMLIAQLRQELCTITEQHQSLLNVGVGYNEALVGVLEVRGSFLFDELGSWTSKEALSDLKHTKDNFQAVIQEYETALLHVAETAKKAEEALSDQTVQYEERLLKCQRQIAVLNEKIVQMFGDCQNLTKLWFERLNN